MINVIHSADVKQWVAILILSLSFLRQCAVYRIGGVYPKKRFSLNVTGLYILH